MMSATSSESMNDFTSEELDALVCVYTCKKHTDFLSKFYATEFGKYLRDLPNTLVLEIYAEPEILESMTDNGELTLKTYEKYENLSVKTYLMIEYCVSNFQFKHLLKVDVILPTK